MGNDGSTAAFTDKGTEGRRREGTGTPSAVGAKVQGC